MTVWIVAVIAVAASLPLLGIAFARPGLRQLAWRGSFRRPAQTLLVLSGVIVATAIVTSAGAIGDSWRASVRQSAFTQLGPVDEELLATGRVADRLTAAVDRVRPAGIDGTLPLVALSATVRGRDFVARVAQAQVLETDFAQAARMGGSPSTTGMSGPTPTGDAAVISADLSDSIAILPGHRVTIYAYGQSRTFRIARVLPRRGIAGLAAVTGPARSTSLNLFVPLGTIASMMRAGSGAGAAVQPVSILAVSNQGGVLNDHDRAAAVTAELRVAGTEVGAEVVAVKERVLADADARSRHFTELFRAFGILSALGGMLLLALTFLMLSRQRVWSMAILRAQGLRRAGVVGALSIEGWGYALIGSVVGALAGVGLAALVVVLARDFVALETGGSTNLVVSVPASSVATGWLIGLLASLLVVVSAAIVASRVNIARVMRGESEARLAPSRYVLAWTGVAAGVAGVTTTIGGLVAGNLAASVVGPALTAAAIVLLLYPRNARALVSCLAVATFVWGLAAVGIVGDRATSASAVVAEGLVLSSAALAFATVNRSRSFARLFGHRGGRGLSVELGLAYANTERRRTTLMTAMYAVVLFTLVLLVTVAHMYENEVDDTANRLGGGSAVEVSSNPENPVPVADVRNTVGVAGVTAAAALNLRLQTSAASAVPEEVVGVGFDEDFIGHGSPPLAERPAGMTSDDAVYRRVVGDPTLVILGRDLDTDVVSGFPGGQPHVGDVVHVRNPASGTTHTFTVIGIAEATRYSGVAHVFLSRSALADLAAGHAAANLLFVRTTPGTNNDTLAAIIDGTHLSNGTYARSFVRLAREALDAQQQFLNVAAAYAAVGLVAALIGIGVLMTDRVRERRRQIAMLRALGVRRRTVRRAFRVETLAIVLDGTIIGAISGLLLANRLGTTGSLGSSLSLTVPIAQLLVIIAAVLATSLVAASVAARRAARLSVAHALRHA